LTALAYDHAMARKRDEVIKNIQSSQGLSREEAVRQQRDWEARQQSARRVQEGSHDPGSANRRAGERRRSERRSVDPGQALLGGDWGTGAEIMGFGVEAADGPFGRVADFYVEEESCVVTEIVVVTPRLLPMRRRVFVPLSAIERIDGGERKIYLRPTRNELRGWSRRRFPWGRS
jgi:hypothetical protein